MYTKLYLCRSISECNSMRLAFIVVTVDMVSIDLFLVPMHKCCFIVLALSWGQVSPSVVCGQMFNSLYNITVGAHMSLYSSAVGHMQTHGLYLQLWDTRLVLEVSSQAEI